MFNDDFSDDYGTALIIDGAVKNLIGRIRIRTRIGLDSDLEKTFIRYYPKRELIPINFVLLYSSRRHVIIIHSFIIHLLSSNHRSLSFIIEERYVNDAAISSSSIINTIIPYFYSYPFF